MREGIARAFISSYLPEGFYIKSGQILDPIERRISPQIDAIIFEGVPLLDYADEVIVEFSQVRGVFEIKSYIDKTALFGKLEKSTGVRDSQEGLAKAYRQRLPFVPRPDGKYYLFTFDVITDCLDEELIGRLGEVCDDYVVVARHISRRERLAGKDNVQHDFGNSVGHLVEWLRSLV